LVAAGFTQASSQVPLNPQSVAYTTKAVKTLGIVDGYYQIKSACDDNLALDVAESSKDMGGSLIVFSNHGSANQQFRVESQPDGAAKITAVHSGFALDVYDAQQSNGAKLIQWPWTGQSNQRWAIEATHSNAGFYKIVAGHSGKALDAHKDAGSRGPSQAAKVQQWDYSGNCNQQWRFAQVAAAVNFERINMTYQKFDGALMHPERGFHSNISMVTNNLWGAPDGEYGYTSPVNAGMTLARGMALLDKHRDGPLPDSALNEIRQGFAQARKFGIKLWFLVMYNFPTTAVGGENDATNIDPELDVVLSHLDQLKPILEENKDVIAGLYNGFIGAWGEWLSRPGYRGGCLV
jgi:hypothetical protein